MNFSGRSNAESKLWTNYCRCCHKGSCSKNISTEYFNSGQREVYEEMLRDTFNIEISHDNAELPNNGRLICEDCIAQLREATAFREMVVRNNQSLVMYAQTVLSTECEGSFISAEVKMEPLNIDSSLHSESHMKYDEPCDIDSFDDDEILANVKLELSKVSERDRASLLGSDRKRKCHKRKMKSEKYKSIQYPEESPKYQGGKDWSKIMERRGNGPILRENSLKLIANSTICVFQWNKSRYRCFCCTEPFNDLNILRDHTSNNHSIENIERKIITQQNRLVKVEISFLHCNMCKAEVDDLPNLKNHLTAVHDVQFSSKEDLLVPFKIQNGDLKCQICFESFNVFRLLNIHMNKHYQKQVCHVCGAGFSNLVFLNLHKSRAHRPLHCKQCDLLFNCRTDKKSHDANVHGVKFERKSRFPCPYCDERFCQENFRVLHLVEKHAMRRPEFKCTVCEKVFVTRSLLNNHVKCVHMKEKKQECEVCHHFFYTKSDLFRHSVTHTGEKKYNCNVCNSNFATKDSLRRHARRAHAVH